MPETRSRSASVARTAAEAGLFSSCVRPADICPRASSRSRWPTSTSVVRMPLNSPSSRCTAIGNHSRTIVAKSSADITTNSQSVTATSVLG